MTLQYQKLKLNNYLISTSDIVESCIHNRYKYEREIKYIY